MPEKRILVVEPEKILGAYMEEYFADVGPQYRVLSVASVSQAIRALDRTAVDVVVSDHQGRGRIDGLQLLRAAKASNHPVRMVLGADREVAQDMLPALSLGCSSFLVKPYSYERISKLVFGMLQRGEGFTGRVVGTKLEDVIQMFCYRRDSTLLLVVHGTDQGTIYIHEGGIIDAQCHDLSGVEAFYEILGWEGGEFLSQIAFKVPEQTVFMDWQSLLMEGLRQKDEIRHALAPVPETEMSQAVAGQPSSAPLSAPLMERQPHPGAKRIMIVDDSRFIRKIVQEIIQSDADLTVAGYAANGQEALAKIEELRPDLILLDWDMPVMKGSTALMHIMIRSPCPVVILSGYAGGVGANPFDLLCLGGVDFLRKPQSNWRMDGRADDLLRRIKEACEIKFERIRRVRIPPPVKNARSDAEARDHADFLLVLGSSTGGCTDVIRLVPSLPEDLAVAAVVVHDMQTEAVGAFIDYLDGRSRIPVKAIESGDILRRGVCYVHPSITPLELVREDGAVSARTPAEKFDPNALDRFLISAAAALGPKMVAVLLSGGSNQGLQGLRAVKRSGGVTVVQEPTSSINPRTAEAALREQVVDYRCSADNMTGMIQKLVGLAMAATGPRFKAGELP